MKKIFLAVLIIGIATMSLSAWEPNDLTTYPSCMEEGNWIFNLGVGLPYFGGINNRWIPPMRLSFDRNTGLGEQKLPFFFGGIVGYSAWGRKLAYLVPAYFVHSLSIGGRFGYHFNWGVDNLDTYAVVTAGMRIPIIDKANKANRRLYVSGYDWVLIGGSIGARYFITDWFGFWAEVGYTSFSAFEAGVSFKL